jgi:hypothetical protein
VLSIAPYGAGKIDFQDKPRVKFFAIGNTVFTPDPARGPGNRLWLSARTRDIWQQGQTPAKRLQGKRLQGKSRNGCVQTREIHAAVSRLWGMSLSATHSEISGRVRLEKTKTVVAGRNLGCP